MNGICYDELPQRPRFNLYRVGCSWFPLFVYIMWSSAHLPRVGGGDITETPWLGTFDYIQGYQSNNKI